MKLNQTLALLGGINPQQFMQRYWQKQPLLIRQAIPQFQPLLTRNELFALVQDDAVESRLIQCQQQQWRMHQGPFKRKDFPALKTPQWTLLVQGVDLHHDAAHQLLQQFRFIPDARLDDLMISYASDQGGVGPHFDSYDVFLLQAHGKRRWRIGRQDDLRLREDVPLKVLRHFKPEQEFVLEPGDMLYLPPRWAHDGVAIGECMAYSIGFRAASKEELGREFLQRLAEDVADDQLYADPQARATTTPAQLPTSLQKFAREALQAALAEPQASNRLLGEYLTEPKATVYFATAPRPRRLGDLTLDRCTRMLYDAQYVFINGESWHATDTDAQLLRQLANQRFLPAAACINISRDLQALLQEWCAHGWLHSRPTSASRP